MFASSASTRRVSLCRPSNLSQLRRQPTSHLLMAGFANTPLEKVETFLFQSRIFQSVAFRNVSLHRGQKTNFAVHVGDEPWEPTSPYSQRRKKK